MPAGPGLPREAPSTLMETEFAVSRGDMRLGVIFSLIIFVFLDFRFKVSRFFGIFPSRVSQDVVMWVKKCRYLPKIANR